uniref:Integrator complex subunit 3 n=1 Tax=Kalanchoe fedtschenkoi TaxID=63787 RepID=A0A7N0RHW8_KALFE
MKQGLLPRLNAVMACAMLQLAPLEAEKEAEVSLRQAFEFLNQKLKPPFVIRNLTSDEYLQLNQALVYGVLCEPSSARVHLKHLHGIVSDGYACFVGLLVKIVNELYTQLVGEVKLQLVWIVKEMIDVSAVGIDALISSLLRRIAGGDFSEGNLWLCYEMVSVLCEKWDWLVKEEPLVVPCALFVFLRVLSDHCRPSLSDAKIAPLRKKEIDFCVRLLREQFHLCFKIGRDLVRILQDLGHVPAFCTILKDLFLTPAAFRIPGFSDIKQLCRMRTSSRYFVLRVTPEMEAQLRFLLTYVKFGNQRRYLEWFSQKFLYGPEKEVILCDIVRFICCAHHPSNEIIQSAVVQRWVVIGWLLKYCQRNYEVANFKVALFYDWLFFDEGMDNIMNIEPAMLLMVHSVPQYIDVTRALLEFLFFSVDNYNVELKNEINSGVTSAFRTLLRKGVVRSLEVLTSCKLLHPGLRERLQLFLKPTDHVKSHSLLSPCSLVPCVGTERLALEGAKPKVIDKDQSHQEPREAPGSPSDVQVSPSILIENEKTPCDTVETMCQTLHDNISKSYVMGLRSLEDLLQLLAEIDYQSLPGNSLKDVFNKIWKDFESNGHVLFYSHSLLMKDAAGDSEFQSATALIIRKFIFSPNKGMLELFSFVLREGYPARALILFYAVRLAYEAHVARTENLVDDKLKCAGDPRIVLLRFHIDGHLRRKKMENEHEVAPELNSEKNLLDEFVGGAFAAYQSYLSYSRSTLKNGEDRTLVELLAYDLLSCFEWDHSRLSFKIGSVFSFLPDLSVGQEVIVRLIVIRLSYINMIDLQFQLGVKKYAVFGDNADAILIIVKNSLTWNSAEQHKLWGLLRSELAVSDLKVERLVLEFFGSEALDANISSVAVEGLLTLCCCRGPTPELVGAIVLLPDNCFQGFSAAVLSTWAASSSSFLFNSLANLAEKLQNPNGDSLLSESGITMNQSAILWILNYCKSHVVNFDIFRKLSSIIPVEPL